MGDAGQVLHLAAAQSPEHGATPCEWEANAQEPVCHGQGALLYNVMRFPSSLEKLKLSLQERLRSFSKDTLKPRFVVNHLFGTVWLVILISIQV